MLWSIWQKGNTANENAINVFTKLMILKIALKHLEIF